MNFERLSSLSIVVVLITAIVRVSTANAESEEAKPVKLFKSSETMNVTLTGSWRKVQRESDEDNLWPAQLTYTNSNGEQKTIDIKAAPRGLTRRHTVCDFPPLKLHFDKEKMKGTMFSGNASLKLVSWCNKHSRFQDYNLKEYLAYRIYNLITEKSFRVRSLNISWQDSTAGGKPIERFGFLIEDPDEVADRHDLEKLSVPQVSPQRLDSLETSRYALFQYLIGNLDWSSTGGPDDNKCCHNSRLIGADEHKGTVYAIPYDFDSSGVVDAHYAVPPERLPVRSITQRLYRGFCSHNDTVPQARDEIVALKADIIGLYENETRLGTRARTKAVKFLNEFFETVNDPKDFQKKIIDKCRR